MKKMIFDRISSFVGNLSGTIKSIVKILLQSRRSSVSMVDGGHVIIMGNGPSLNETIENHIDILKTTPAIAVNFAANAPQFTMLKPRYYVLADPHFFVNKQDVNVAKLMGNLTELVDWTMTLFVPNSIKKHNFTIDNKNIAIEYFNMVGVEGFQWFENYVFSHGYGMPRPRNVLIPSIMIAMQMGYKEIYITGADHSWTKTLSVNENNEVVSIQPHFYKEDEKEQKRIRTDYLHYPLHQIIYSFYVAFKSYFVIQRYATNRKISIYNSTPESFIDAFPRRPLPQK